MLMGRLIACLALAGLASPAAACINDNELPAHEREFRSQYAGPASAPPAPSAGFGGPVGHRVLIGAGAALLTGGVAMALIMGRSRG
jgi:hypothetical protein